MTRQIHQHKRGEKCGFTLVELLVVIVIIGILAGLLAVTLGPILRRVNTFAVQQEMGQLEGALEKFNTDFGFYPPSFKGIMTDQATGETLDMSDSDDFDTAIANLLPYINRIAPNHSESELIDSSSGNRDTFIRRWFLQVGQNIDWSSGEDLVFWLSGLNKNKQYPLTGGFTGGYVAFNARDLNGNLIERDVRFDFKSERLKRNSNQRSAGFLQAAGEKVPYLYLDAGSYLPRNMEVLGQNGIADTEATDGAYANSFVAGEEVTIDHIRNASPIANDWTDPSNWSRAEARNLFEQLYPNPNSFQLVSFGIDGVAKTIYETGDPQYTDANPNKWSDVGSDGGDNVVNFAGEGPNTLETMLLGSN